MIKHTTYIILLFIITFKGYSQNNIQVLNGHRSSVSAARILPSTQNLQENRFEFNLNYNLWVANKSISYGTIKQIQNANRLTTQDVQNIIDQLDVNTRIGAGQDFLIVGLGLRTKIKTQTVMWNFTISDRLNANAFIPKTLVQLVWQGNKQFEGKTIDISETAIAGLYFRDYSLGFATAVKELNNWNSSVGMRIHYYQGLAGITNSNEYFYVSTDVGAESIQMKYDYDYRYTGIDDFDLFDTRGHGFGLSLGTTVNYKDFLTFDLAVTDIGSLKFNQKVYKLGDVNTFEFGGLGLDELMNPTAFLDSVENILTPEIDTIGGKNFKVNVGAKLSFMASWQFGKNRKNYGPFTLAMYYLQGFSEHPGSTINPEFTLALHRTLFHYLDVGVNATWGGFNNFAFGGLVGLHLNNFRLSIHSDNFTGFIFSDNATGAAGGFMIQFIF